MEEKPRRPYVLPTFEALVTRIVADYATRHSPATEAAWVAEVDGVRVGCVFLVAATSRGWPDCGSCSSPRPPVVSAWGARLVEEALAFAREAGYRSVGLWTTGSLASARRIYERFGFTLTDEETGRSFGHDLVSQNWTLELGGLTVAG